jgi:upstream-binding transcription factor
LIGSPTGPKKHVPAAAKSAEKKTKPEPLISELDDDVVDDDVVEVTPNASKQGKRKPTDPRKPKRKSAYFFFSAARRKLLKEQHPTLDKKGVDALLKNEWNALDSSERKQYEDKEKKDQERFDHEMARYYEASEVQSPSPVPKKSKAEEKSSSKKKKDPSAPKKGKSAYILFTQKQRGKGNYSGKNAMARLGAEWKALSDAEKAPFEALAKADKARYDAEMTEYKKKILDEEVEERSLKRQRSGVKNASPSSPKRKA